MQWTLIIGHFIEVIYSIRRYLILLHLVIICIFEMYIAKSFVKSEALAILKLHASNFVP